MDKCDSCGSKDKEYLFNVKKHEIVKCLDCDFVYMKNPLLLSEAQAYYESTYNGEQGALNSCYGSGEHFRINEANSRLDKIGEVNSLFILDEGFSDPNSVPAGGE